MDRLQKTMYNVQCSTKKCSKYFHAHLASQESRCQITTKNSKKKLIQYHDVIVCAYVVSVALSTFSLIVLIFRIVDSKSERNIYIKHYQNKRPSGFLIMMLFSVSFTFSFSFYARDDQIFRQKYQLNLAQSNSQKKKTECILMFMCCVLCAL